MTTQSYRVQMYWPGRTDPPERLADQLFLFLSLLARVHPSLTGFLREDRAGELFPVDNALHCRDAVLQSAVDWATGRTKRRAYSPRLVLERRGQGSPARVNVTFGLEPLGLGPTFVPNRLEFLLRTDARAAEDPRGVIEGVLRAGVEAFAPSWASAGSDRFPEPPIAVFSGGEPAVGWMLYLANGYPAVPKLPEGVTVTNLPGLGTLIVVVPGVYRDGSAEQRERIELVRTQLANSGVLIPMPL